MRRLASSLLVLLSLSGVFACDDVDQHDLRTLPADLPQVGRSPGEPQVVEAVEVGKAWSGHPVGFDLVTVGDRQFVAYYDESRALTVAERTLGASSFRAMKLPSTLGWDSHNAVVLAIDDAGLIHVAGNMHSSPLVYFRSTRPRAVDSLVRQSAMVGRDEQSCTYPTFFRALDGSLTFMYRSGSSGNGDHIFNRWDAATGRWQRLLDTPLTDGQGQRNAYPVGPVQGPDGRLHLVWVWRDTPDASTNHDLSYAVSRDLRSWQSAAGRALTLPITLARSDIVDPVPVRAGMINNNTKVGFDSKGRTIVSYHKYDAAGRTQLYNARFEGGRWVAYQTSQWDYRWAFGGNGTLVFEIQVEPVEVSADGTLIQRFYHAKYGGVGAFRLDEATLRAVASVQPPRAYPASLDKVTSTVPGMEVRVRSEAVASPKTGLQYMLRWETLPSNRDTARATVPPATRLVLYGIRR